MKKDDVLKFAKETPEERKQRASSGIKHRATVFKSKKKAALDKPDWRNEYDSLYV